MRATLIQFAETNDAVAFTASKLAKQKLLADYFRALDDDDLRLAVRYAGGRAFPATDERVLNVGGAIVTQVAVEILHADPAQYFQTVLKSGEIGDALAALWKAAPSSPKNPSDALQLSDLAQAFDQLARHGEVEARRVILRDLFARCLHPREAAYLAKIIFGDLRTGVQEGVLQAAGAAAFEKKLNEIQRAQLLLGDLEEVAILARHNMLSTARFRLMHPIQFMLATPQETAEIAAATIAGRPFFIEDKLDGIRAQVHKSADAIAIYTRTLDRTENSFPEVTNVLHALPGDFLLDGEIVPYRDGRVLPFADLQKRLGRKSPSANILRDHPAAFIAFDLLYLNGELWMDRSLRDRRAALEKLAQENPARLFTTAATIASDAGEIARHFESARQRGNEGIVLKDADSIYAPGKRGKTWLKLKTHLPTLDCVVTAAEFGHGKRKNSLSDYTFAVWNDGQLANIGKAFSGVTDEEIAQLTELFLKLSRAQHGHLHLVEPKIVMEIAFDQIQKSKRHASGFALRFPRIKRIRWDKRPEDADTLARVTEIYESERNFGRSPAKEKIEEATLFDGL